MPLVALAAGALLGGALFHMVPESLAAVDSPLAVFAWVVAGIFTFHVLEQFPHWHHCHRPVSQHRPLGYLILVADGLHNLIGLVHALPRLEADFPFYPPGRFEEAQKFGCEIIEEAEALAGEACPAPEIVNHVTTGHHLVVVGTDGSTDSTAALTFAFAAADLDQARLRVVSALGVPQGWPSHLMWPLPEDDEEVAKRRQEVENQVAPFREWYPGVEVELDVHRVGPIHTLATASHRADLLVVGSRGRGGFHGLAVGSTTHKLLHLAGCPMAVVRADA